jgi:hypothetical protein
MIQFEEASSPFYLKNRDYCRLVEAHFIAEKKELNGWCNSFAFDVNSNWEESNERHSLRIYQEQSSNGKWKGLVYAGTEYVVKGCNPDTQFYYGRAIWKHFRMKSELRRIVPFPFYIKSDFVFEEKVVLQLIKNDLVELEVKEGTIKVRWAMLFREPISEVKNFHSLINSKILNRYF